MSDIYELDFNNPGRGMFSVLNDLIDHLYVADKKGYKVRARWLKSAYKEDNTKKEDAFSYYFESFFEFDENDVVVGKKTGFARRSGNLITPRDRFGLAQPKERCVVNAIIDKYIRVKPNIQEKIYDFYEKNFNDYVIGLHLRGKGRERVVSGLLKKGAKFIDEVPYNLYFDKLNEILRDHKDCKVFLCSDSQTVVDHCMNSYGNRIITYDAVRSIRGETHRNPKYRDQKYTLGEDVLVEAYLLSMTNYLIHGNSNVSNFVLCKNCNLKNYYIYEKQHHSS